ncbi:hypothetical protein ACHAXM_003217, partial [Skeletonema potamos]
MCCGVRGDVCLIFSRIASICRMHFAMNEFLEAILFTQHTVGWLSLNKATCLWS